MAEALPGRDGPLGKERYRGASGDKDGPETSPGWKTEKSNVPVPVPLMGDRVAAIGCMSPMGPAPTGPKPRSDGKASATFVPVAAPENDRVEAPAPRFGLAAAPSKESPPSAAPIPRYRRSRRWGVRR